MKFIIESLVFAIPITIAAILHMILVKKDCCPRLKFPLDHFRTYRGKRIFGEHKTYRGLVLMMLLGVVGVFVLHWLSIISDGFAQYNIIYPYQHFTYNIILGLLLGLAYIIAELPNSFMKRQLDVHPGKSGGIIYTILDQADSPFLCLLVSKPLTHISWQFIGYSMLVYIVLHLSINYLLFLLKIRKNPY